MTRNELKPHLNQRKEFEGVFVRFGEKHFKEHFSTTVLLRDVHLKNEANILTDHIWLNYTKRLQECGLSEGDVVVFEARVTLYEKGYRGRRYDEYEGTELDYKLSHPTNVRRKGQQDANGKWF